MAKTSVQTRPDTEIAALADRLATLERYVLGMSESIVTKQLDIIDNRKLSRITMTASDTDTGVASISVKDSTGDTSVKLRAADDDPSYAGVWLYANGFERGQFTIDACRGAACECDSVGRPAGHASLELQDASGEDRRVLLATGDVDGFGAVARTGKAFRFDVDPATCEAAGCAGVRADEHAWLLSAESRGFEGAVELFETLNGRADFDYENGQVRWLDFPEFVAAHNWQNPDKMRALAELIDTHVRMRLDRP